MKFRFGKKTKLVLDELRYSVGKLELKPGDVIVAKTDLMLDRDEVMALRDRFHEYLIAVGIENKCMVLTHGIKIAVIRKEPKS